MTTAAPPSRVAVQEPVRLWRLAALVRAGYSPNDGRVLSRRLDVDLHLAVELLEKGCPPETAMRILL